MNYKQKLKLHNFNIYYFNTFIVVIVYIYSLDVKEIWRIIIDHYLIIKQKKNLLYNIFFFIHGLIIIFIHFFFSLVNCGWIIHVVLFSFSNTTFRNSYNIYVAFRDCSQVNFDEHTRYWKDVELYIQDTQFM